MPAGNLCRLCLAMDAPVRVIAGSPLQDIYEKLTGISLNTPHRPVGACYICFSLLRKCYSLMVRSVRADEVLTRILQSGGVVEVDEEFVAMINRCRMGHGLSVTPPELIAITDTEDSLIKTEIMEDPQLSHRRPLVERFKFEDEGDVERAVLKDVDDIEDDELIYTKDIKQEVSEEDMNMEVHELTGEDDITLSEQKKMRDIERLIHDEDKRQESEGAPVIEDDDSEGAALSNKCKETHENTQDRTTPTPGGENIMTRLRKRRAVLEEDTSTTNTGSHKFRSTKKAANNKQVLRNITTYFEPTINKGNINVNSENECTSTSTDVDNTGSEQLTDMLICNDCGNVFDNKCLLIEHIERHDIKKKSNRTSGNESLHQRTALRKQTCSRTGVVNKHTETHSGNNVLECGTCHKVFKYKSHLNIHISTHTGEKPFQCEICQVKFTVKYNLKCHLRTHTGEKPFECKICQVKFTQKSNLKKHLRIHIGKKPFECDVCQVKFTEKNSLNRHLGTHIVETPFKCELCQVKFTEKGSLESHLRTHTGEKPFECEICQARFIQKSSIKNHLRIHTGEKPFECEICHVKFAKKYNLKCHVRTHTGEKPFECKICQVKFTHKRILKNHLRIHTGEKPFECEICQAKFIQKGGLLKHLRIHTGEKPFKCEICQVKFTVKDSLKSHLRIHTGEKPFECEICQAKFSEKSNLNRHKKQTPVSSLCIVRYVK